MNVNSEYSGTVKYSLEADNYLVCEKLFMLVRFFQEQICLVISFLGLKGICSVPSYEKLD